MVQYFIIMVDVLKSLFIVDVLKSLVILLSVEVSRSWHHIMLAGPPVLPKITDDNKYLHSLPPFANAENKALSNHVMRI